MMLITDTDTLGITVNNSAGGLWFTSNSNGTRTIERASSRLMS